LRRIGVISVTARTDLGIFYGVVLGYRVDIESSIDFIENNVDLAAGGNHSWPRVSNIDKSGRPLKCKNLYGGGKASQKIVSNKNSGSKP
jgi:hypothetical protein